jgi:hypothetical protein
VREDLIQKDERVRSTRGEEGPHEEPKRFSPQKDGEAERAAVGVSLVTLDRVLRL